MFCKMCYEEEALEGETLCQNCKNTNISNDLKEDENFIHNKFGYCYYSLEEHLIYNLYVHPQYRRCGHSRKLLEYVIAEIKKEGYIGEIKIQAKPKEDSISVDKLIEYYKSIGLEII